MTGRRNSAPAARPHFIREIALLAFLACAGEDPPGSVPSEEGASTPPDSIALPVEPPVSTDTAPNPDADGWTLGIVDVEGTLSSSEPLPMVLAVRSAAQDGFDRLTIELGPGPGLPGYHIEYVDRPLIQCGSGQAVYPVGDAWLEVRLYPANAHTEAGAPTLPGREIPMQGRLQRRLYMTCDFEAVVTLVSALEAPNPYRVTILGQPPRIVIDVRH